MPRYHFNVQDGHSSIDTDGTDLLNYREARREAVRLAGSILKDQADRLLLGEEWSVEVTDAGGLILFHLDCSFRDSAAVAGHHANDDLWPER